MIGNDIRVYLSELCPVCFGSGKIKAMQAYMTYDAGPIRGPDTKIVCPYCKGTGKAKHSPRGG